MILLCLLTRLDSLTDCRRLEQYSNAFTVLYPPSDLTWHVTYSVRNAGVHNSRLNDCFVSVSHILASVAWSYDNGIALITGKHGVLGPYAADARVIECEKRAMPHAHLPLLRPDYL